MAILLDEKTIKLGHIDGFVFRKVNGKIVAQSMPSQYTDANSPAQQKQRSGMRNILAFYRMKLLRELIVVDGCLQVKINGNEWKRYDVLRLIRIESSNATGDAPAQAIVRFKNEPIYKPVDQTITTPPLPHGAYAFVHLRYRGNDTPKVSTEHLMII